MWHQWKDFEPREVKKTDSQGVTTLNHVAEARRRTRQIGGQIPLQCPHRCNHVAFEGVLALGSEAHHLVHLAQPGLHCLRTLQLLRDTTSSPDKSKAAGTKPLKNGRSVSTVKSQKAKQGRCTHRPQPLHRKKSAGHLQTIHFRGRHSGDKTVPGRSGSATLWDETLLVPGVSCGPPLSLHALPSSLVSPSPAWTPKTASLHCPAGCRPPQAPYRVRGLRQGV